MRGALSAPASVSWGHETPWSIATMLPSGGRCMLWRFSHGDERRRCRAPASVPGACTKRRVVLQPCLFRRRVMQPAAFRAQPRCCCWFCVSAASAGPAPRHRLPTRDVGCFLVRAKHRGVWQRCSCRGLVGAWCGVSCAWGSVATLLAGLRLPCQFQRHLPS